MYYVLLPSIVGDIEPTLYAIYWKVYDKLRFNLPIYNIIKAVPFCCTEIYNFITSLVKFCTRDLKTSERSLPERNFVKSPAFPTV